MIVDWNWFFAAFAQCAAALIAIIGAFVISKLLGESEKEEMQANKIDQLIIHYNNLIKRISARHFHWYDKESIESSTDLEDAIRNGEFQGLQDSEMLQKLFEIEPGLFRTESCLDKLKEKIAELTPTSIEQEREYSIYGSPLSTLSTSMISVGAWNELSKEKETINQLKFESDNLIDKF